ncbi:MAG: TldD/PmbA family protein [Mycobacteriales bacterium]
MTDLSAVAADVVARATGDESVEAFVAHSVETSVTVFGGDVESLSSSETRGLGVRVVVAGRLGFAATSDLTPDGIEFALREARSNAELATPDAGNVLPQPALADPLPGIFRPDLRATGMPARIAFATELERATIAADPRLLVESATYGDAVSTVVVASSTGVDVGYERSDAYAHVAAIARDGDEAQTGFGLTQGRGFDELDLTAAAAEGAARAVRLLGGRKPKTVKLPVVFDPMVTASFLGVVSQALTAEAVQKGRSLFADRVGDAVLGAGLALVDDGRLLAGPAAAPVDDEGVPTRRTELISAGVLRAFLHNTETAARAGATARSTGNASRAGFKSTPGVSPSNLFLDGATRPRATLLRDAGDALYVQDVSGIHSGVNPVSGEFSVGATGLWLRGGEFADPVREATVSSTIIEMFSSLVAIADDRRFFPFGGALAGATLLLGEMTVAGS